MTARELLQRWLSEHPLCIHADETRAFLAQPERKGPTAEEVRGACIEACSLELYTTEDTKDGQLTQDDLDYNLGVEDCIDTLFSLDLSKLGGEGK